jgi:hypothetical protein
MGFDSGSISFRRFAVMGEYPQTIEQSLLDQLFENAHQEEAEYGWCAGRHILDNQFTFDNNAYADALHFGLRIDTNKVPSEVSRAYRMIEEEAASRDNPSGFISRKQKRDARDGAAQKIDDDLRSGRFRRSKLTPILWDLPAGILYCNATISTEEKLKEIFERSFGLTLEALSAGALALRLLESRSKRRDYEDAKPTRFVQGPDGEGQLAEYPWVAKGPQAKDFLGNEFMVWLWHEAETTGGVVRADDREPVVLFERTLDMDCVYGQTGRAMLRINNGVTHMLEARDGLRSGKVPRRAGLIVESSGAQYVFNLGAEMLAVRSLRLPKVEDAESPRVLFEERIGMLRDFSKTLDTLFGAFLRTRTTSSWEGHTSTIRKWITRPNRASAPAVSVALV